MGDVQRRRWDKEQYLREQGTALDSDDDGASGAEDAPIRDREEFRSADSSMRGPTGSKRKFLRSRTEDLGLDAAIGQKTVVAVNEQGIGVAGWFCDVCRCHLRDNIAYLDHINGKKHQRALGFSMRTERSTLEQVRERLRALKEEDRALRSSSGAAGETDREREDRIVREYERRVAEEEQQREEWRRRKKEERRQKKEEARAEGAAAAAAAEGGEDAEIAALLGFGGFK